VDLCRNGGLGVGIPQKIEQGNELKKEKTLL
jgi:hypothetical protein